MINYGKIHHAINGKTHCFNGECLLVNWYISMERSTIFMGKLTVKLPEGNVGKTMS